VDAGGTTIVPGMVDGHSHLTLPGGSHWIDRGSDPTDRLLAVAGTWVTIAGLLPPGLSVEARDGDELLAAALAQLDDGADFVKLYLDAPTPADFSLVHGDPLSDPTAMWRIWRVA
jgi:hypothetical protein